MYPVATPEHFESLALGNYVRVVALASDLWKVSFHRATVLLHYNPTIKLFSLLVFVKGLYPSLKPHCYARRSSVVLWLLWYADLCNQSDPG